MFKVQIQDRMKCCLHWTKWGLYHIENNLHQNIHTTYELCFRLNYYMCKTYRQTVFFNVFFKIVKMRYTFNVWNK